MQRATCLGWWESFTTERAHSSQKQKKRGGARGTLLLESVEDGSPRVWRSLTLMVTRRQWLLPLSGLEKSGSFSRFPCHSRSLAPSPFISIFPPLFKFISTTQRHRRRAAEQTRPRALLSTSGRMKHSDFHSKVICTLPSAPPIVHFIFSFSALGFLIFSCHNPLL